MCIDRMCILDQSQGSLIVLFELKRLSCLMSFIFSDAHTLGAATKMLAHAQIS